jgi:hypothetical protein
MIMMMMMLMMPTTTTTTTTTFDEPPWLLFTSGPTFRADCRHFIDDLHFTIQFRLRGWLIFYVISVFE